MHRLPQKSECGVQRARATTLTGLYPNSPSVSHKLVQLELVIVAAIHYSFLTNT